MKVLYNKLIDLFIEELKDLQIGYSFNNVRIMQLKELMLAIYLLENADLSREDSIKIIEMFV